MFSDIRRTQRVTASVPAATDRGDGGRDPEEVIVGVRRYICECGKPSNRPAPIHGSSHFKPQSNWTIFLTGPPALRITHLRRSQAGLHWRTVTWRDCIDRQQ